MDLGVVRDFGGVKMTRLEKMLSAIKFDKELLSESEIDLWQRYIKVFLLLNCCINEFDLTATKQRVCPNTDCHDTDCHECWNAEAD